MSGLKNPIPSLLLVVACVSASAAQERFSIDKASNIYNVVVKMASCSDNESGNGRCSGPGTISISRKNKKTPFQVLSLRNVEIDQEQLAYNPEVNRKSRKIYDDEFSFVFGDFNFDGAEDLAICTGKEGGYGAPSYAVYVYNATSGRFVENKSLSRLTIGYLGLFFVDTKKKQLIAYSKSGCCYHVTERYRVVNNRPMLVEKVTEDATDANPGFVVVTTKRLVNGKWVKSVKKTKAE